MNKIPTEKRAQILGMLVEGNSLRSASRLTDVSINTVTKLLIDVGTACAEYQDVALRNLPCKRVQCNEIWSFCRSKQKNVPEDKKGQFSYGDVWTWIALCADTKLIASWMVGTRDSHSARSFISDLEGRLANRIQLTTDGHKAYLEAVEESLGADIDYSRLVKLYYTPAGKQTQSRYSPGVCKGTIKGDVCGKPEPAHASTSYVELQNLTMRMSMRRFTSLTNEFSKKIDNHMCAIALHFMHYNFCRVHKTLQVTPAMEAGIARKRWTLEQVAELVPEPVAKKRGPYKKRENSN